MMPAMPEKPATPPIPVPLSASEFTQFLFPHLTLPKRGTRCKRGDHRVFTLLFWRLYTGMQWQGLPVPKDPHGNAALHDTTVSTVCARGSDDGSLEDACIARMGHLADHTQLDVSVLHGDGLGSSGSPQQKGEKVLALIDNNGCVGGCDAQSHRKALFKAGMIPNINENPRNRTSPERGRKRWFNAAMHALRERGERTFAWEDKCKRLLLRSEYIQQRHYGMKLMAYTLINVRRFCSA